MDHRKTLEKIAALAQKLGCKTYISLSNGYDLILAAGGERGTSVYPDGTAIDSAELVLGGKCWEPQAVTFYDQKAKRAATVEEIAVRGARQPVVP